MLEVDVANQVVYRIMTVDDETAASNVVATAFVDSELTVVAGGGTH